jgi:hypothetical protein
MKRFSLAAVVVLSLLVALTVQSATKPTGTLKVPAGLSLELRTDGKPAAIPTGRDVPIVAGTYVPASLTCGASAPAGKGKPELWTIKCTGPNWGKLKDIPVEEGATTTIEAGPPFTLKTIVYKTENGPSGKVVPITVRVVGKAGEIYDLNTFKKGLSTAPQLALQILDEKGTVLSSGTLPYG